MSLRAALFLRHVNLERVVYATITIMSVLIVYDGWTHLRVAGVVSVVVGPVLAMFLAHVFAALLARQAELAGPLRGGDLVATVRAEAPFLLLCVPPLLVLTVLYAAGVALVDAIQVTLWAGVGSLGLWGLVAGRRAGYTGWRVAAVVTAGLVVGIVVLALQVVLQPGRVAAAGTP